MNKLQELAERLGARAAERLDVERTAQAVLERLRTEPAPETRRWEWVRPAWLRIAAAVVIVLGVGAIVRNFTRDQALPPVAESELNDLSTDQLRAVLDAVDQPGPAAEETIPPQDVGLEDLSAPQLRALLQSLEG